MRRRNLRYACFHSYFYSLQYGKTAVADLFSLAPKYACGRWRRCKYLHRLEYTIVHQYIVLVPEDVK